MSKENSDWESPQGFIIPIDSTHIPDNVAIVNPDEAYRLRKKQINSWDEPVKIWPLKFGPAAATIFTTLSSYLTNIHARQFFQLYSQHHFWATIVPTVAFSALANYVAFTDLIEKPIIKNPFNHFQFPSECEICLQIRGSVIQVICGLGLPFGVSFLTCSLAALRERTYPVPHLTNAKGLWKVVKNIGRSFRGSGSVLLLGHVLLGSGLVSLMLNANKHILDKQKMKLDSTSVSKQ